LIIKCEKCGNDFNKSPSKIAVAKHNYCKDCRELFSSKILVCENCGEKFKRFPSQLNSYKHNYCKKCFPTMKKIKILIKCDRCKKDLQKSPNDIIEGAPNYCKRCKSLNKEEKITLVCNQCKNSFERYKRDVVEKDFYYCSKECYAESKFKRKTVICKNCNNVFEVILSSKQIFCCDDCKKLYRKTNKKICVVKCEYCGKDIQTTPSKSKTRKFCSLDCEIKQRVKTNKPKLEKVCLECKKIFSSYRKNQKYCSNECATKNRESYGERETLICTNCNKEFVRLKCNIYINSKKEICEHFCSVKCKRNYYVGERTVNYVLDRTKLKAPISKTIRTSRQMEGWRKTIFERDRFTCQITGETNCILNAHHIIRFADNKMLRTGVDNGITLSESFHKSIHSKEQFYVQLFQKIIELKKQNIKLPQEEIERELATIRERIEIYEQNKKEDRLRRKREAYKLKKIKLKEEKENEI